MPLKGPSASERELALLLAGTSAARTGHEERLRMLTSSVDFAALEAFLREESMLSLIGHRLKELAAVPDWFCNRVDEFELAAQRQNLFQQMLTVQLCAALAEADVRALPLKGPLLGERLYGRLGARVSADIDLLVAERDLSAAERGLADFGYRADRASEFGTSPLHSCLHHSEGLPEVELHWRVHWNERRFSADLLARSTPGPDGCLLPTPADELVELLLLYARDGFAGLRLVADIAAWWDSQGSALDPSSIAHLLDEHRQLSLAIWTAGLAAERLVGLPAQSLLAEAPVGHASSLAMRLVNWPKLGSTQQIKANISLVDWVITPVRRWPDAARRQFLLPPRRKAAMEEKSRAYPGWMIGSTALHVIRLLARYCIALLTIAQRGAWTPFPTNWETAQAKDPHANGSSMAER